MPSLLRLFTCLGFAGLVMQLADHRQSSLASHNPPPCPDLTAKPAFCRQGQCLAVAPAITPIVNFVVTSSVTSAVIPSLTSVIISAVTSVITSVVTSALTPLCDSFKAELRCRGAALSRNRLWGDVRQSRRQRKHCRPELRS